MSNLLKKNWWIILIIIAVIAAPIMIWKDQVKFAPEILLNEWYKTLFISGIIGLFYKFYVEKKITYLTNSNIKKKELDLIANKLLSIDENLTKNNGTAKQNIIAIVEILKSSEHNHQSIKNDFDELSTSIFMYKDNTYKKKQIKEIEKQILYQIKRIIKVINDN